ncbi:protein phosphatase [Streptomyces viridochromogenes]|uniref:Protein phosphatase n=1 Tax=Streptomyces viridochromogenes TaxID=1938 RepID=A0A0J7YV89_STRVR|nr:ATP-binding SpoIIE family protein phosphatase [Streptomyces viridochromogenes]KMS67038.1 protein phosphatase [Streptomyces viridochromogenes]KOG15360.1 protein phosphatase [Streptomyces viridochromogenes]KOG23683.1 protein phosphatase [Streptomyces viridochromogenes]
MGAIPAQRETVTRASGAPAHGGVGAETRTTLPGSALSPGSARTVVRNALTEWAASGLPGTEHLTDRLVDDAVVVVSELVTNAVVHAGTDVELTCRLEDGTGALVVEVLDHHPSRAPRDGEIEAPYETPEYGRGLRLVSRLAESWGVTYRTGSKTVWARLPAEDPMVAARDDMEAYAEERALERGLRVAEILAPEPQRAERDRDWLNRGALSFLAEASDLLAGQLDENLVAALAGQLIVPRLADWCAVWLEDEVAGRWGYPRSGEAEGGWAVDGTAGTGPRLARVWHGSENLIEELRRALEKEPPLPPDTHRTGPVAYPWPGEALGARGVRGTALAYRLVAGGRPLGTLVIGRADLMRFPDEITGLVEDLSRRVALAIGAARQYARQATISRVLQRGLLPGAVAEIPGVASALVYEPCDKGGPSGDFYDLFPAGDGRWCFAIGDVQGKGPEAAVVIGIARPWLRLLAREGYRVADVLDRLNQLLLDDATEAADAAARALVGPVAPGDGPQTRFLSLLYGELTPFDGGIRCTLASAGHPLPLLLGAGGEVHTAAHPQTLLGVIEDATYTSETFELLSGDTLLCVTDGVTERRSGSRQFDDGDGLATALAGCSGLNAQLIAERIRRLVHEFSGRPPEDDLALLVLQAE